MRRIPWQTILLMFWPYAAIALNLILLRFGLAVWLCGWLLTTLAVAAGNVRCALRIQDTRHAAWLCMAVKLVHIPAYVVAALLCVVLFAAPPVVLALLVTEVCMLVSSSSYGLRAAYRAWRQGELAGTAALLLGGSQLIFVLDVIGCILLYMKTRKSEPPA